MVAYHDLYDCRVDQWQKAADDWVDLARRSSSACEDIRAQGKKPLDDHWADATGKQAGGLPLSLVGSGQRPARLPPAQRR
ncbi:hypothetical protein [Streptomyces sp. NPDC056387]|uniref:hypothetical protein n=1 Tax=Streptomyces sp. NPDC056387 TaxID=3345803 RepID=UPI0035DCC639